MGLSELLIYCSFFLFSIICYIDIRYYKIPNWSVILILILGLYYQYLENKEILVFLYYILLFFIVIFFGLGLFLLGVWGAGDAKLLAASIFLVDLSNIAYFICGCFICAVLWVVICLPLNMRKCTEHASSSLTKAQIPFAPGIFSSLIFVTYYS